MRNAKSSIWLVLSFSFVLGHSLVPHAHRIVSRAQCIESRSTAEDFWHTLSKGFTLDLGAGHLEDYRTSQELASLQQTFPDETDFLPEQFRWLLLSDLQPAVPDGFCVPRACTLHGHAPQGLRAPPFCG